MNDDEIRDAGFGAVNEFIAAFNAQDHERLAASLNYPHVRLANGSFYTADNAEGFAQRSAGNKQRLIDEGWHHTTVSDMNAVHLGPDKVHVALRMDRCAENGDVYNRFDTLWIVTLQEGHWGIQFRSSYLR